MGFARRRLSPLATGLLLGQLCLLTVAPSVICAGLPNAVAVECTCSHGDGQTCPLHHPAPASKSTCSCRSTTDPNEAAIASLLGPIALVPASLTLSPLPVSAGCLQALAAAAIDVPSIPDSPPPRA